MLASQHARWRYARAATPLLDVGRLIRDRPGSCGIAGRLMICVGLPLYRFKLVAWCLTWGSCDQLCRLVVLVDHATEDLAPPDRKSRGGLAWQSWSGGRCWRDWCGRCPL